MTVGWPLSAAVAGRVYLRIGFRNTSLLGRKANIICRDAEMVAVACQDEASALRLRCRNRLADREDADNRSGRIVTVDHPQRLPGRR